MPPPARFHSFDRLPQDGEAHPMRERENFDDVERDGRQQQHQQQQERPEGGDEEQARGSIVTLVNLARSLKGGWSLAVLVLLILVVVLNGGTVKNVTDTLAMNAVHSECSCRDDYLMDRDDMFNDAYYLNYRDPRNITVEDHLRRRSTFLNTCYRLVSHGVIRMDGVGGAPEEGGEQHDGGAEEIQND